MCGRYVTPNQAAIERAFDLRGSSSAQFQQSTFANLDASPTQSVPLLRVIRDSGGAKQLVEARWGFIPARSNGEPAKDRSGRPLSTFNARIETLRTNSTYRDAWRRGQRCLVPVRGFYEWQAQPPDWQRTVRHYITVNDQEMFCFAGLWDRSIRPDGTVVESVTIITMPANELMKEIHNSKAGRPRTLLAEDQRRMPAILAQADQEVWLFGSADEAWAVLKHYPSEFMVAWPVNGPVDPDAAFTAAVIQSIPTPGRAVPTSSSMMISVFIDSNAWNILFEQGIDLTTELPANEFVIYITREVEVEILAIPETKADLKRFILETLERRQVVTTANFGFAEAGPTSAPLGHATFQSVHDREWYAQPENGRHILNKAVRPTGLGKNQVDASLAVRSGNSIILTNDARGGPLADAARQGGNVRSLAMFDRMRISLRDYILIDE